MYYEDEVTQEEFDRLTISCEAREGPKSTFQLLRDRTTKEFISILEEWSCKLYNSQGRSVSICRLYEYVDVTKLQDWLESLGETRVEHRSWSKVEVRLLGGFIVITNTATAKNCTRRQHNQNMMFNIEKILEDNYLKEKQYEQRSIA